MLSGNQEEIAKLSKLDFELIPVTTLTDMTTDEFDRGSENGLKRQRTAAGSDLYTDLIYQPMQEVMQYLRATAIEPTL